MLTAGHRRLGPCIESREGVLHRKTQHGRLVLQKVLGWRNWTFGLRRYDLRGWREQIFRTPVQRFFERSFGYGALFCEDHSPAGLGRLECQRSRGAGERDTLPDASRHG